MYASLAYGVKGLSYYTTYGALLDSVANKTTLYNDLKSLNTEIRYLGDLLLHKQSEKLYQTGIMPENNELYFLDRMEASDLLVSAPDNLVIGVFGDDSAAKYLLIANMSHSSQVEGKVKLRKPANVLEVNRQQVADIANRTASINIKLPAGMGALYIIKK
jgi:hypothetical protein